MSELKPYGPMGDRISCLLRHHGLNQSELARQASLLTQSPISRANVSRWVRGMNRPTDEWLSAIAAVLKVSPREILPAEEIKSRSTEFLRLMDTMRMVLLHTATLLEKDGLTPDERQSRALRLRALAKMTSETLRG